MCFWAITSIFHFLHWMTRFIMLNMAFYFQLISEWFLATVLITTLAREYSASILHQWTVIIATKTITIWLIMGQSMHMGKLWRGFCDLIYYLCCDKEKNIELLRLPIRIWQKLVKNLSFTIIFKFLNYFLMVTSFFSLEFQVALTHRNINKIKSHRNLFGLLHMHSTVVHTPYWWWFNCSGDGFYFLGRKVGPL